MKIRNINLAELLLWLDLHTPMKKLFDTKYFLGRHDGVLMEVKPKQQSMKEK